MASLGSTYTTPTELLAENPPLHLTVLQPPDFPRTTLKLTGLCCLSQNILNMIFTFLNHTSDFLLLNSHIYFNFNDNVILQL